MILSPTKFSEKQTFSRSLVFEVWCVTPWGRGTGMVVVIPDTFSGDWQSQNCFHNNTKIWFAFFTMLTFALIVQKQRWVKLEPP